VNSKQQKTLKGIFKHPIPKNLEWAKIESLLIAAGAELVEGRGSRVRFVCGDVIATFHRPHPHKEAKPYQVRDAKFFLEQIGVKP